MDSLIAMITGFLLSKATDGYCYRKYGSPSLSIIIALCWQSKHWNWLTWRLWGDDTWYYRLILTRMEDKRAH